MATTEHLQVRIDRGLVREARAVGFDQGFAAGYLAAGGDRAARLIALHPSLTRLSAEYESARWTPVLVALWAGAAAVSVREVVDALRADEHPDAGVLAEVIAERGRQDAKWGEPVDHPDGTGGSVAIGAALDAKANTDRAAAEGRVTWRHILREEVAEAFAETDPVKLRAELVQVAAVTVKWLRMLDARLAAPAAIEHNTWSWGCQVPQADRPNGDALDAHAVCGVCEPSKEGAA